MIADVLEAIDGLHVERDAPSGPLCTYRVGGPIDVLVRVETAEALHEAVAVLAAHDAETITIGKGSNLLIADDGFRGVALVLGDAFSTTQIEGAIVRSGGAAALPVVARSTVNAGLAGFEWAVGVPGSIGGAVRMNAGGHGSDMAATLVSVDIADLAEGTVTTRGADSLDLEYRSSSIATSDLVVSATLQLVRGDAELGATELKEIVSWRRANQPGGANAGSVFTNPKDDSAGRLIDSAGLKGHRVGSAEVSPKHANFIQADAGGRADDVMALMVDVVERVQKQTGVALHAETRLVGFDDELVAAVCGPAAAIEGEDVDVEEN